MYPHTLCSAITSFSAIVLIGSAAISASPSANAQAFLDAGERTAPPQGAFALCAEDRETCGLEAAQTAGERHAATDNDTVFTPEKTDGSKAAPDPDRDRDEDVTQDTPVVSDAQVMAMAQVINTRINTVMQYRTDRVVWGVQERWVRPLAQYRSRFGDCEDFALEKRAALLEAGVPADRLRMAVAWSRSTGVHAVLIVRTAEGDFVLDNATAEIRRVDETGYQWRSVQSGTHLLAWSDAVLGRPQGAQAS